MSQQTIALIAGEGGLPAMLAAARPDLLICEMEGTSCAVEGATPVSFRFERLVPFLDDLAARGIKQVVFAGALARPQIEQEMFDLQTAQLVPRLLSAMNQGDDATLREVITLFDEWGMQTIGIHQLIPELLPAQGLFAGTTTPQNEADADRAAQIVGALGAADVGQGCVVSHGLCLAVETLPGTDAMLRFAGEHRQLNRGGGVFFKAPKPGQERRIDLPAIGPDTVANVARAGLSGIVIEADGVMILDQPACLRAAREAGIFIWVRPR